MRETKFYFPGQKKRERVIKIKVGVLCGVICLGVGFGGGAIFEADQSKKEFEKRITTLEERVSHFENHWAPIRELEKGRKR